MLFRIADNVFVVRGKDNVGEGVAYRDVYLLFRILALDTLAFMRYTRGAVPGAVLALPVCILGGVLHVYFEKVLFNYQSMIEIV